MTRRARLVLCALALVCLLPAVVQVARYLPAFGAHPLPYGDAVNRIAPAGRRTVPFPRAAMA